MKGLYVFLGIVGVIGVASFILYYKIRKKIRTFSKEVFGTVNIMEGLAKVQEEADNTPYSITNANRIYQPRIEKDFPDFHSNTLEEMVKKFLTTYLNCLESLKELSTIRKMCTSTVIESVKSEINDLKASGKRRKIDDIKFHAIAISGYVKTLEYATVRYQVALEYTEHKKIQSKYEVHCTYVFKDLDIKTFGLRCNHCGAPLETTSTTCEYCGTIFVRNIEKVWRISNYIRKI